MFRLQDNTPEVYINNSRDFQLFCRLYDVINNGVRFDANTITDILNPMLINDRMLDLLCTKIGFFTRENIPDDVLRVILSSFPYAIKYKGSKTGILYAVCAILKMEGTFEVPEIIINDEKYEVQIYTSVDIKNKKALSEYLKYIIPVGYTYIIEQYVKYDQDTSTVKIGSNINTNNQLVYNSSSSQIRGKDRLLNPNSNNIFDYKNQMQNDYMGSYITSSVVNKNNNENEPDFTENPNSDDNYRNDIDWLKVGNNNE